MNTSPKTNKHDDYFTPKTAWENIKQFIPKDLTIWEAFYHINSKSADYLKELGFNVIYENIDFFTHNKGDIIVSNPPFSIKNDVLRRLCELDKPFILIMPCQVLTTQYTQQLFKNKKLQVIIPKKRIMFQDQSNTLLKRCSFDCFYYCYKIGLENDITYL